MKKIIIGVVLLAAILLLAPYGVGKMAEKRLNAGLDKIVKEAPYLTIVDRKWTGGWFKSRQDVTFELSPAFASESGVKELEQAFRDETAEADAAMDAEGATPDAMPDDADQQLGEEAAAAAAEAAAEAEAAMPPMPESKPVRFTVHNDVLHGPVLGLSGFGLARVDTSLDLPDEVVQKIRAAFGPKPALEVSTRVGFFGGGTTTFISEGRTIKPEGEEEEVVYDTFKLAVGFSKNANGYDLDGSWPKLEVKGPAGTVFSMTGMTIDGDMTRVTGELYDGDFAFRIADITVPDKQVTIKDAHYVVDTRTKDGFVTMAAKLGTGEMKSPAFAMTGLDIKEVHYDFSFRHLHAESMDKLMQSFRESYAKASLTKDPTEIEEAFSGPLKEHAAALLSHDPELGIDRVGVVTPEGEGVVKGVIKFVGVTLEDFAAPGGMGLISKLDADITIEVAQKLLEKLPNGASSAGAAVDSGYAKRDGDKIVSRIQFKDGQLTVNGKPQAIPGLGGPPQDMSEGMPEE